MGLATGWPIGQPVANPSEISLEQQTDSHTSLLNANEPPGDFSSRFIFTMSIFNMSISRRSGRSGSPPIHQAD
jgi:hypothetical protein